MREIKLIRKVKLIRKPKLMVVLKKKPELKIKMMTTIGKMIVKTARKRSSLRRAMKERVRK